MKKNLQSLFRQRPWWFKRKAAGILLLLPLLSACSLYQPSFPKSRLPEEVQKICRKEYNLDVQARYVGKTFYVSAVLDGLVGQDLGLQADALNKLEGAMLSATRVALSTDADINFVIVKARDPRLGVLVTLVRYLPDIKSLIYMRISRSDFEERLVMETEASQAPEAPNSWQDIPMTEFLSRLVASRLQRQFAANPLVSAFLRIRQVRGTFKESALLLRLDEFDNDPGTNLLIQEILRTAVEKTVLDVMKKYGTEDVMKRVVVKDSSNRTLLDLKTHELTQSKVGLLQKVP